jgi:hypothetical protein
MSEVGPEGVVRRHCMARRRASTQQGRESPQTPPRHLRVNYDPFQPAQDRPSGRLRLAVVGE